MNPGGFLIVDKPSGWTSHDVVAKCRGIFGIKKIGHMGTLDPLATGVLVLAVSKAYTKQIQEFMGCDKEYEVEMELGKSSDTYDSEGQIQEHVCEEVSLDQLEAAMQKFWGETEQMPPAFSAKKVNGQRAYKLARAGKEVKLKAKAVSMEGWGVDLDWPMVRFKVKVSTGTYVRSLVHDIGQGLGCGAIMTGLRRTRVGQFDLDRSVSIDTLESCGNPSSYLLESPSS